MEKEKGVDSKRWLPGERKAESKRPIQGESRRCREERRRTGGKRARYLYKENKEEVERERDG